MSPCFISPAASASRTCGSTLSHSSVSACGACKPRQEASSNCESRVTKPKTANSYQRRLFFSARHVPQRKDRGIQTQVDCCRVTAAATQTAEERSSTEKDAALLELQCPRCGSAKLKTATGADLSSSSDMSTIGELQCESCGTTYPATGDFTNMLLPEDDVISGYNVTFKNPAVASIYETPLWTIPGRPPFEVELEFTQRLLQPKHGGVLLDLSCGPGRTGRALAASRNFARIYGVDFSSAMLGQARQKRDAERVPGYPLIRADCRRLPFADDSFDAIYAGAALHVWPSLRLACSEVSRVLKPGGIWIASTFLVPWESALAPPVLLPLIPFALLPPLSDLVKRLYPVTANRPGVDSDVRDRLRVFSIDDFKGLVEGAGLVKFECIRFMGWAIIKAEKPL